MQGEIFLYLQGTRMTKTTPFSRSALLLWVMVLVSCQLMAQGSDLITVRKPNGRTVKTFTRGSFIEFIDPGNQLISGYIQTIRDDSVFIGQPDIRKYYSQAGGVIFDTIGTWYKAYHYKELLRIKVFEHSNQLINFAGSAMMIGGIGYAGLNIINGAYLEQPITDKENLQTLGIALGVFATGLALKKIFPPSPYTRKKHRVMYIRMSTGKTEK